MKKNLKSREVLDELQKKVDLKIALRDAKKEHDDENVEKLSKKDPAKDIGEWPQFVSWRHLPTRPLERYEHPHQNNLACVSVDQHAKDQASIAKNNPAACVHRREKS